MNFAAVSYPYGDKTLFPFNSSLVPSAFFPFEVATAEDNALAETIKGLYYAEGILRRGPWRRLEIVGFATLTWVDWFNNRPLLEPFGPHGRLKPRNLPRHARRAKAGRVTQTKRPPASRFIM